MNYGLYVSASGVLVNMHRQDVLANNLANAGTPGFKSQLTAFRQRPVEVREDGLSPQLQHRLLDRTGGGLFVHESRFNQDTGALTQTPNDLDLAISGSGFMVVGVDNGQGSDLRLTRDGRLTLSADGQLISQNGRHPVLDSFDRPITIDPDRPVQIQADGTVLQDGDSVGRIQLVDVPQVDQLQHLGHGVWSASQSQLDARQPASGEVLQGWLEGSNVDPVKQLVELIETTRAVTNNANLIRYHDTLMDRAINGLGRVA